MDEACVSGCGLLVRWFVSVSMDDVSGCGLSVGWFVSVGVTCVSGCGLCQWVWLMLLTHMI